MVDPTHAARRDGTPLFTGEREAADAQYNAALTAVDRTLVQVRPLPPLPLPPDEQMVTPLNERFPLLVARPKARGWLGRIKALIWRVLEPALARQEAFNATLVDHVNRSVPTQRETHRALAAMLEALQRHAEDTERFQAALILYLQTITAYVDTKDRDSIRGFAAGLSGLSDEILKCHETLAVLRQRLQPSTAVTSGPATLQRPGQDAALPAAAPAADIAPSSPTSRAFTGAGYVGFEDRYRGSEDDIRGRLADYVPLFDACSEILDVGCGRGEMLELLREAGVKARGIDVNDAMVARCRSRGFAADRQDGLSCLRSLPPAALGGLIAIQVVEHLAPDYLVQFLASATRVLRPGAPLVLETINPACWSAFFDSYIRDLSHVRPVHADTLQYLVSAAGFVDVRVMWRAPHPVEQLLPRATVSIDASSDIEALATAHNGTVERLNALCFTHRDYAVVARRP